jgi:hypothetical protein
MVSDSRVRRATRVFRTRPAEVLRRHHSGIEGRGLGAIEAGVFPWRVGWHCQDCPVRSRCWAWG